MHRFLRLAVLAGCVASSATGATFGTAEDSVRSEEQRVLAVEDEWVDAEINRDGQTLRRVIDERFVYNSSNGKTSGRAALIRNVLGLHMVAQNISERTVLVDGETAIVCGTAELRFASAGKEEPASLLRYTAVYVKRQGQWRAIALQMTQREGT
jgi:ketosteroid isomerase-like protein